MAALYDSFHRNIDIRRGKIGRHLIKIGSSLSNDRLVARRRDFGAEFAPQFWRRFVHRSRQPIANDFRRSREVLDARHADVNHVSNGSMKPRLEGIEAGVAGFRWPAVCGFK